MTRTEHRSKKISDEAKLNKKYLTWYKSWKKEFCPALNKDVYFTNKGWQHIHQEKWRDKREKEQRLKCLLVVKNILRNSHTIQSKRVQDYHNVPHLHYGFSSLEGGVVYTVVVIEDKGQFDFLSCFRVTPPNK